MVSRIKAAYRYVLFKLPVGIRLRIIFYRRFGFYPDLKNPKTFNEKILHRKLYVRDSRITQLSDKFAVKAHVSDVLGADWVIPTHYVGKKLPSLENRNWPLPFVIKSTGGSGQTILVTSDPQEKWSEIERQVDSWLSTPFGEDKGEWGYASIDPQVIVEPMIGNGLEPPPDYKFFVYSGHVKYVQVDTGRYSEHRRSFYDREWNRIPVSVRVPAHSEGQAKPEKLSELIKAAELLGQDWNFVRVDFYDVPEGLKFGEITFYPVSGMGGFIPETYDKEFGRDWRV